MVVPLPTSFQSRFAMFTTFCSLLKTPFFVSPPPPFHPEVAVELLPTGQHYTFQLNGVMMIKEVAHINCPLVSISDISFGVRVPSFEQMPTSWTSTRFTNWSQPTLTRNSHCTHKQRLCDRTQHLAMLPNRKRPRKCDRSGMLKQEHGDTS